MRSKTKVLFLILFALVMFSLTTVVANENVTSDLSDNDMLLLPSNSTISVESDNVDLYGSSQEISLEKDNKTDSLNTLKMSDESLLGADLNGGSFNNIQTAINNANSGDTIYLNGQNYIGNKQITINKNIVIDGASSSNPNLVSTLDANKLSRVFYSSSSYNIQLKNLILTNPNFNGNGYFISLYGGNILLENIKIENQTVSGTSLVAAIYIGANSNLNVSGLTFKNNTIVNNNAISGAVFNIAKSTKVTMNRLYVENNEITSKSNINGFIYVNANSGIDISNANFYNNVLNSPATVSGGALYFSQTSNAKLSNFRYNNNTITSKRLNGLTVYAAAASNFEIDDIVVENNSAQASDLLYGAFYINGASSSKINNVILSNNFLNTTSNIRGGFFYSGSNSNIVINNIQFNDNTFLSNNNHGGFVYLLSNSNVNLTNIKSTNNIYNAKNEIYGSFAYMSSNSKVNVENLDFNNNVMLANTLYGTIDCSENTRANVSDVKFNNNNITTKVRPRGAILRILKNSKLNLENLNVTGNTVCSFGTISAGLINTNENSDVTLTNLNFNNNNVTASNTISSGFYGAIGSSNVKIIKSNISDNYVACNGELTTAAFQVNGPSNLTIDEFNFENNYVESFNDKTIAVGFNLNGASSFNVTNLLFRDNTVISPYLSTTITDPMDQGWGGLFRVSGKGLLSNTLCEDNFLSKAFGGCVQLVPRFETPIIVENSTFINTTIGAADIDVDRFHYHDHGGVICVNDGEVGYAIIRNCDFIENNNSLGGAICPHNHCIIDNCNFINNTATKFYGGAISTNLEKINYAETSDASISIYNCYFEGNKAPLGGAIQAMGNQIIIDNCTFVNNSAVKGGAVFLQGNTVELHNSTFIDNKATDNLTGVLIKVQDWLIPDWDVDGGAVYIYGSDTNLCNNTFRFNTASGSGNEGCGGAMYVHGDNTDIEESHFDDNFAQGGNGSAIYVYGLNTTINTSEFFNHSSAVGTVYIIGDNSHVLESIFEHNIASLGGGAIYAEGNFALIDSNNFTDNNATVHGGAIYVHGDFIVISNSDFFSNHAIPHPEDQNQGLGGAIYIMGNYNEITKSSFDLNTARNGSAIYNKGHDVHVTDDNFLENQAFSYLLNTTATPKVSYYNGSNQVLIEVVLVGGDNILNAIHNDGKPTNMFFHNVTYEHSTGIRTTTDDEVHPVDGAQNSNGGKLLYQDPREDYQNVTLLVVKEKISTLNLLMAPSGITGDVILDGIYKTGLYGNVSILLTGLSEGLYTVYSEHPEDKLYKQIDNTTEFEILPLVDLEVIKEVSDPNPKYGDEITWTVTVINHGHSTAKNVIVEDSLPEDLIYLYDDSEGEYDSENGIWYVGDLAHNEDAVIVIHSLVDFTNGTRTNIALAKTDTPESNESNNEDNDTINVEPLADLAIEKIVSNHGPKKNDVIVWTVRVTNNGPDTAVNARVVDVLPAGLEFLGSDGDYADNIWTIGDLKANESAVLNIETRVLVTDAVITNVANVTSDTPDYDLTNNEDNSTIDIGHEADLEVIKFVFNNNPNYLDIIKWTIIVTNYGPDRAIDVVVHDKLPAGLLYVCDDSDGAYDVEKGIWTIGTLQADDSVSLTITTLVTISNDTITNVAVVSSDTHDNDESNNEDNDTITVDPCVDLDIIKIVNNHSPKKDDIIRWTVRVTNNGPDTAVNARVVDVLPAGLEFLGSDGDYKNNVWTIGNLEAHQSAVLNINTKVLVTDAVITNVANVTSDTPEYDLTNNEDNSTIDVGHEADLEVKKVVSNPNPNYLDIITWTITVTNNGPDRAIDVVVLDELPYELTYISDDSDGAYDEFMGIWTIGTLQANESVSLTITTSVDVSNDTITNIAVVSSDTHDPDESNNVDNDTITVNPCVDLEVIKTVSNTNPKYLDTITWTILVFNHGPDTAYDVTLSDKLPEGLIYLSDDSDGKYDYETGIWDIGELHHGRGLSLNIECVVNISNATITNVAVANTTTYDYNKTNNEDNGTITVDPCADLAIVKTVSDRFPKQNDIIVWTLNVTNNGPNKALNAIVSDILPAGLEFLGSDGEYADNIWYIGDLEKGQSAVLNIETRVLVTNDTITNVANVTSDTPDLDLTNNEDNSTIDIGHEADLEVRKVVSNPKPEYLDIITWTITVTNKGPDRAIDAVVLDSLPDGLTYISDDSNGKYNVVEGVWNIGTIESGADATLTITTQVNVTNSTITNIAVVSSNTHDPNETNNEDNDTITVDACADLSIEKMVSNHNPKINDIIVWTIVVTNNGPDAALNAIVSDVLPQGLKYLESDGDFDGNIWNIGDLANGDYRVLNIKTQVMVTDTTITNVANVSSDTPDNNLSNNEANSTVDIDSEVDLEIIKVVSNSTPMNGELITWTITVINNGPDTAENVMVTDKLPDGLVFIKSDGDYDKNTGIWNIGNLGPKASVTLTITTQVNITDVTITNVAVVNSTTYDYNSTNNQDNDTIVVEARCDLAISKTVSNSTPRDGDFITWTITVKNNGPDAAHDVVVTDILPQGLEYEFSNGDYDADAGIWNIGTLDAKASVTLTITTEVDISDATITNVAVVNSSTYDYNDTNNRDNDTIIVEPSADLEVVKVVSDAKVNMGDVIAWAVTVTNNGPDSANDIIVTDILPAGLIFISADGDYDVETGTWKVGTLAKGEALQLEIITKVNISNANITNDATVNSSTYDFNLTNNKDKDTVSVEPCADLEVIKVVSDSTAHMGDVILWTVTVINHGPDMAQNVVVVDKLPSGLVFVSADGSYDTDSGVWTVGDLANGASVKLDIFTKVDVTNANITNVAVVNSTTYDPNMDNNIDNDTVWINPEADIMVVKTVSNPKPYKGDIITWTIVVTNLGPDTAENVFVEEIMPAGLKLISSKASKGKFLNEIWTVGSLENGEIATLTLTTQVTASKGTIENVVIAKSSTHDPNMTNNKDKKTVTPKTKSTSADLELIKNADKKTVKVGDIIVWTITVINHGPDKAVNVRVSEMVDVGECELISAKASKGKFFLYDGDWIIGDMEVGEKVTLQITVRALFEGKLVNYAYVISDTPDPNPHNDEDKATVIVVKEKGNGTDVEKTPLEYKNPTLLATGNPVAMAILALFAIVCVNLRRKT